MNRPSGSSHPLVDRFLAAVAGSERPRADSLPACEEALRTTWEKAIGSWPGIDLDPSRYWVFLARRLPSDLDLPDALESIKTTDLYLVCACLEGIPEAQKAFLEYSLPVVKRAISRIDPSGSLDDEVLQGLLERLFTSREDQEPKLGQYNGRSTLAVWVRVSAARQALNLVRSVRRERPLNGNTLLALVSAENQEMSYFKSLYQDEFKKAFHQVLARLTQRERNLLTCQLVEGLSMEQIGELYRVNRSTVSRWLSGVRKRLQQETRQALMDRLAIETEEFESIMKLIMSRFDASVVRVLAQDETPETDQPIS
jgi:RNA polymerase sigma-70 factor, ECF subfamily